MFHVLTFGRRGILSSPLPLVLVKIPLRIFVRGEQSLQLRVVGFIEGSYIVRPDRDAIIGLIIATSGDQIGWSGAKRRFLHPLHQAVSRDQ